MKKNPNIDTNYYLQRRYDSGEIDTNEISFTPDKSSPMHTDYSQDSVMKSRNLNELHKCIEENMTIKKIVETIPTDKTVNLSVEVCNKLYSFCMILLDKNKILNDLTKIDMFDLITDYLNLNEKEVKYFHKSLSITFKTELLEELEQQGLYKSNRLF